MKRREFLGLTTMSLSSRARGQHRPERAAQPNFIFIMADDLGVYDLGCYGQKLIHTPNIDRLAAEGMRFTDAYAGATVCAPSRSVLMTGQHTGHTTVRSNESLRTGRRVSLTADDVTVAEILKGPEWRDAFDDKRGYATAIFGKWGLGEPGTPGLPNDHGFDEWFGFLNQQHAHGHFPEYLWRNKGKETLKGNLGGGRREYASDLFAREALYFIERHRYEPFYLYFTPTVPHARFETPSLGSYANESWPDEAKNYAAMVSRMDAYVGQIMAKLKETGLDENTVVFFTSDNGGIFEFQPFHTNGPLRAKKGSIYEGGIRVPMIVRWPGHIRAGAVSNYPWSFCDVLPTLADLAGCRGLPRNIDGVSVAPALTGRPQKAERPMYWESYEERGFHQAVRMGRWKGVRHGLTRPLELYDLQTDIAESKDVAGLHKEVVTRMEEYLRDCRTESADYPVQRKLPS
ncbi:MAG TPA: arylsulfatase [Bryobacteraceae bacterium]|nr:arylsulfatase [Bryobacteraceae bacterium]